MESIKICMESNVREEFLHFGHRLSFFSHQRVVGIKEE